MPCAAANASARSAEREATATNSAFGTSGASPTTFDAMRPGPTTPQRTVMSPILVDQPHSAATSAPHGSPRRPREAGDQPPREGHRLSTNAHPARRLRLILVPLAAVGLAGLVACGTGSAPTGSTGSAPDDTAMAAFASCLAENGVTLPERGAPDGGAGGAGSAGGAVGPGGAGGGTAGPGAGAADGGSPPPGAPPAEGDLPAPPGVDAAAWAAAQEACAQYAPTPP